MIHAQRNLLIGLLGLGLLLITILIYAQFNAAHNVNQIEYLQQSETK